MSSFKSHTPTTLTIAEKVGFALVIANAFRAAAQKYVTASIYSPKDFPPRAVQMQVAMFCAIFCPTSIRQQQTIPASSETYREWTAEQTDYSYAGEDICSEGVETRLLWVGTPWRKGDPHSKKVVLYSHGGGFSLPLVKGHVDQARWVREELQRYGGDVSIALLEYSLAPHKKYPTQLCQGVIALNHLLAAGCPPSNIALMGDSAGGQLTLSILSHILHPHPDVPKVLPLSSPLAAAITISPWVTFDTTSPAFNRNRQFDLSAPDLATYYAEGMMGRGGAEQERAAGRHHVEAKLAPESWWEGLHRAVQFVGTTAGKREAFVDDIMEFDENLRTRGNVDGMLFVGEREVHNGPLLDFAAGRPPSEMTLRVAGWLGEAFKAKN